MLQIVYIALFMLFAPRYIFSFYPTKSARITFKEVLTHGVVFGFVVLVAQFISKRYGVFEGFTGSAIAPPSRPMPMPPRGVKAVVGSARLPSAPASLRTTTTPTVPRAIATAASPSTPAIESSTCPQITLRTTLGELCTTYGNK